MRWLRLLCALLLLASPVKALDFADVNSLVNLQCVEWKVMGPCFCGPYNVCLLVEYYEPGWIVETVKIPGSTAMGFVGGLLQTVFSALGVPQFGGGGAGNASGSGHANLQYNEAHVITFPQMLGGPCTGCSGGQNSFTVHYASEIDPVWRTATGTTGQKIGVWSFLYPRGGKAIHGSEPVGSGIAARRAMNIASMRGTEQRVVLQPTERDCRCMQLALPKMTDCMIAGQHPATWETRAVSKDGTYLWLFWRKRTCCVDSSMTTCGITLVGGHGRNRCLLDVPIP